MEQAANHPHSLTPGLGDCHFHILEMMRKQMDPLGCLDAWFSSGMAYLLDVGVDLEDWPTRAAAAKNHKRLYLAAGCHPHCASQEPFFLDWETFRGQLSHKKTVAVGEIGLDYYRNSKNRKEQQDLFTAQLEAARDFEKPIIIHNRDADSDILGILKEADLPLKGVFHCFSSDRQTARAALDLGYYLSFSGNITYPSAENIREAAIYAPLDRIFAETDSPYLAPIPFRGKINSPPLTDWVLKKIAEIKKTETSALALQMTGNFKTLFNPLEW